MGGGWVGVCVWVCVCVCVWGGGGCDAAIRATERARGAAPQAISRRV